MVQLLKTVDTWNKYVMKEDRQMKNVRVTMMQRMILQKHVNIMSQATVRSSQQQHGFLVVLACTRLVRTVADTWIPPPSPVQPVWLADGREGLVKAS